MNQFADEQNVQARSRRLGVRHFQTLLLFFGSLIVGLTKTANLIMTGEMDNLSFYENIKGKPYVITEQPFFIVIFTIICGYITTKINNRYLLLSAGFVHILLNYVYPSLGEYHIVEYLHMFELVISLLQTMCTLNLLTRWLTPLEIAFFGPLIYCTPVIGMLVKFFLAKDLQEAGSRFSFHYFSANCGLVWWLAYAALGSSGPESCWYISDEEKKQILNSLQTKRKGFYRKRIPWRGILTCMPLYFNAITFFSSKLGHTNYIFLLPLALVLNKVNLHSYTLLKYQFLFTFIFTIPVIWLANFLQKSNLVSQKTIRYTISCIGQWGAGVFYLLLANSHGSGDLIIFGSLCFFLNNLGYIMLHQNILDLSQNYAGFVYSLVTALNELMYTLSYFVTRHLINSFELDIAWRAVTFVSAAFLFLSNFFFTTWGSVKVQTFDTQI